jgi:dihydroorotase-like cyclic amidohydrolase
MVDRQPRAFVLRGGRLIDPAGGRDGLFDIRVRAGKIETIAPN